jgi:TPP-dependent pyruvate/acetoin dehydrogenase alpha subunit
VLTDEILIDVDQRVVREMDEAVAFAETSPDPDASEAATDMYA